LGNFFVRLSNTGVVSNACFQKRQNSSTLTADYGKSIDFPILKFHGVLDIGLGITEMFFVMYMFISFIYITG